MLPGYQAIAIPASLAYISNWPGENSFLLLDSKGILLARIGTAASLFWHELMPGILIVAIDYVSNQFLINIVTTTLNK